MADWSRLPYDIIHKVAAYLEAIEDFHAFSAVCHSWRSVYLAKQWHPSHQVPLLMLSGIVNSSFKRFFSLYTNKVYNSELLETCDRRCLGTSSGWLLTVGSDLKIHLFNPFTHVHRGLPPTSSLDVYFGATLDWYHIIDKAVVIKKPNKEELLVFVIYGYLKQLAFCRPGYSSWKSVSASYSGFTDVKCLKDQIFALHDMGTLVAIDINDLGPPKVKSIALPLNRWTWEESFLVESSGSLWMIYKCQLGASVGKRPIKSIIFFAWTFDFNEERWVELPDLGNHAIFLDDSNCCMSVFEPERLNCKSNSIYFVSTKLGKLGYGDRRVYCDVGVYDMTSQIVEPFCCVLDIAQCCSCPVWVMPSLH
ncbi:hypothetical protein BUALT_Bualt12G0034800 [Buddleja alternifolia]|uniref:F-box protein n=1 Tax=Buddleja alternifolia TaxID=168488 RepID=A0AAV6WN46_9LAMI|nr:hypothetical protein BUALT_Bualt12G0034800 [Buddleja alternifolia]